jgi:hypothetical protein
VELIESTFLCRGYNKKLKQQISIYGFVLIALYNQVVMESETANSEAKLYNQKPEVKLINELRVKVDSLTQELELNKNFLEKAIADAEKSGISLIWEIWASPSRSDYAPYVVMHCSSYHAAKGSIGGKWEHIDLNDNCTWYYSIRVCDKESLTDFQLSEINRIPKNFMWIES